MTDVLETHDRSQFAVYAYYCGINRVDPTQLRIRDSVDSWVDISGMSDEQAAAKIATDEVDILVDLNGYTKDARTRIFAFRPAPIVVNWFGFPGTMATPYHHYIIADEHVIPPGSEIYYSEKVLRLACYQPNDRKRQVSDRRPTRSEEGLPETAVVYCCLNGAQKIIPSVFDSWMTILRETPGSVLWLLGDGDDMEARLKGVAESGGVSPERLVFARKKANPEHLARYVLADLFLDTFPYGAHTTAADAIWMGVPVLTTPGKSFASRVCASLAHAAGIGELVCPNPESYVARAIELGRDSGQLLKFKQRLAAKRNDLPAFRHASSRARPRRPLQRRVGGVSARAASCPRPRQPRGLSRDRRRAEPRERGAGGGRGLSADLLRSTGNPQRPVSASPGFAPVERRVCLSEGKSR